jgi:hypothetical protein
MPGMLPPSPAPAAAGPLRWINQIVIHCSATPNGRWFSPLDIDFWHRSRGLRRAEAMRVRMNPDLQAIGYHFIILTNGAPATGRHIEEPGAHTYGHNRRSIGTCLIGTDKFTAAQWYTLYLHVRAMVDWVAERRGAQRLKRNAEAADVIELAQRLGLRIVGHRDLSPDLDGDGVIEPFEWLKTCPGFSVADWLAGGMVPLQEHLWGGEAV